MSLISIAAVKGSQMLLKLAGRGGSLPGSIGLKLDPMSLKKIRFSGPVILVTGTNGKTSTANMIADTFENAGYKVVSNRRGDNLREGIATAVLSNSTLGGKMKADAVILEIDELNVRHILPVLPVSAFVVNNFFRDQLDRAREMEQLIVSIESVLPEYRGKLILNANDPNVYRLAKKAPAAEVVTFGLAKNDYSSAECSEASEGKFCPSCGHRLEYKYYQYSHIGDFYCDNCGFQTPVPDIVLENADPVSQTFLCDGKEFKGPYEGMYSMYNYAALLAAAKAFDLPESAVRKTFENAPQPFGRNEKFKTGNKSVVLNLIKNPTGANEVMKVIEKDHEKKAVVIVLNDRDQDGTDVSWIYDTLFEKIMNPSTEEIICTGLRANDMALRLYYGGYEGKLTVKDSFQEALDKSFDYDNIYVIATYTALQPSRQIIVKKVNG